MAHIDDEQWNELKDLFEEDFLPLIKQFVADSTKKVATIKQAHEQKDNRSGLDAAHSLKGASANLGANTLSKHCFTMQEICHAKMIDAAHNIVADIETEFKLVVAEINQRLAS